MFSIIVNVVTDLFHDARHFCTRLGPDEIVNPRLASTKYSKTTSQARDQLPNGSSYAIQKEKKSLRVTVAYETLKHYLHRRAESVCLFLSSSFRFVLVAS